MVFQSLVSLKKKFFFSNHNVPWVTNTVFIILIDLFFTILKKICEHGYLWLFDKFF